MRALTWLGISVALSLGMAAPSAAACDAVGDIRFICDVSGPEDLAVVPGSQWVIASGNQDGGRIQLVSVPDKTATALFPVPGRQERLDAATYPTCPRIDGFTLATTAIQSGEDIWLGTNSGETIAYCPVPR